MKKRLFKIFILALVCCLILLSSERSSEMRNVIVEAEKPPMFVLQVGIGKYNNSESWKQLKGAVNDVAQLRKILEERFKVPKENFAEALIDDKATKQNIIAAFEKDLIGKAQEFFQKTKRRDAVVLFQFSGHGSQVDDLNGDESDGKDETFVTVNSEDKPNKNFDITDDEIYELTKKLGQFTDNIVFILDSCHSGSGTRGNGEARNIKARETQPVAILKNVAKKTEKDSENADILPFNQNYIVISASRAGELAIDKPIFEDGKKLPSQYQGRMTFYLLKALRESGETTTYRDLMDSVRRDVASESDTQTPQLEGESLRPVFGGLSRIEDNTIQISKDKETKQIYLEAGAMQSVMKGTILELRRKTGEKFGSAKVTQTNSNRAIFETIPKDLPVTNEDRAVIISSDLTAMRLRVLLDGEDTAKITAKDKDLIGNLQRKFTDPNNKSHGVDLLTGKWNDRAIVWDIALLKDRFDKVFPDNSRAAPIEIGKNTGEYESLPANDAQVFYIVGKDLRPLYGFFVEANKDNAERSLEKALIQLVRLRSVRAIVNKRSSLFGKIQIKPVRLNKETLRCEGLFLVDAKKEVLSLKPSETAYKFKTGEPFWLEVTNNSGKDVYITVLGIGSDGSVKIHFPRNISPESEGFLLEAKAGKNKRIVLSDKCADNILITTPPAGIETFKIIATTVAIPRRSFEFLEMTAMGSKGRNGDAILAGNADWTTAEINFEITAAQE